MCGGASRHSGPAIISVYEQNSTAARSAPVALITGAAKRLGAVMARHLHSCGYVIAIHCHRSSTAAQALADELNASRTHSAFVLQQDLALPDAGSALIEQFQRHSSSLDLLVNSASIFEASPLAASAVSKWDQMQAINTRTPYFLSLAAAKLLREQRGAVVNITDIHASRPRQDYAMYCISKAGLIAVTRALALELAPDVRVNAVSPGAILWAASEDEQLQAQAVAATPLQRRGEPSDIATAVAYLATAPYVTGQVIEVDGGRSLSM